jgi:glucokinase
MLALALEIGGSHASCALVDDRNLLVQDSIDVDRPGFLHMLPRLERLVYTVLLGAGISYRDCAGLVLGFPGIVDSRSGRVISTNAKFSDAIGFDLPRWAKEQFGLEFVLENDCRLALLGEHFAGAATDTQDVVLVTLGTGIGAAAMLAGKPLRGRYDQSGCLGGHLPVVFEGRTCTCGNVGCAEAEASTWALPQICRDWPGFSESALAHGQAIDFACLFAAADRGDEVAEKVLARCYQIWGALAVALIHAYSPEILLFGGGVLARERDILPAIREHVHRCAWSPRGAVQIKTAALGASAALYGAVPRLREVLV